MSNVISIVLLLSLAILATACNIDRGNKFTITGTHIVVETDLQDNNSIGDVKYPQSDKLKPLTVIVSTTSQPTEGSNDFENTLLSTENFVNDNVVLTGTVDRLMEVTISVDIGGDQPLTLDAILTPGATIAFALVDHLDPYDRDHLVLFGHSPLATDTTNQFLIKGDLSSINEVRSFGIATAWGMVFNEEYEREQVKLGQVMLNEGKFIIEGNIEEPTIAFVTVEGVNSYFAAADLIVEPNYETSIFPRGSSTELISTSNGGTHANIIESWQQSNEYLSTLDQYTDAVAQHMADMMVHEGASDFTEDSGRDEVNDTRSGDESEIESNEEETFASEDSDQSDNSVQMVEGSVSGTLNGLPQKQGCEHILPSGVFTGAETSSEEIEVPTHYIHKRTMNEMRMAALQDIAKHAVDPFESLLAMEWGAFPFQSDNINDAIFVLDRLSSELDENLSLNRVAKLRERFSWYKEADDNNIRLQAGQKAPPFTLPDLKGSNVVLYDILSEKSLVLLDFWASWCGPCIAVLPKLKELYSSFHEQGFEIVSVSIDSTHEDWSDSSETHELPWTDLGEIEGWEGAIATAFGVTSIPKGYLIDSIGCIVQKDIGPSQLKELLEAQFNSSSTKARTDP